ncbi:glycosyltransferase family 2 protein [bacterium]|nr:glycosyltransferase family 2 protein [bacterium]MDY3021228.1 glycosyltransferase family 2 protein [Oliverpabstia sp.]
MKKEIPCVSVIVPIYNNEAYLDKCIQSLINQTYKNLQIILVNDGSKDSSLKICDKYNENDSRIIVIHKENGGASSARKAGIEKATGEYVIFVDGDDWIELDTCEESVRVAMDHQADCVMFGYVREHEKKSISNPLFENDFCYDKEAAEENIHRRLIGMKDEELVHPERVDNIVSVCMKLYRLDVAKKGKFVDEKIVGTSEDTIFNIYALDNCRVSYINKCFYHYRKTNAQSITSKYKEDLPERWDVLYQLFEEYLIKSGKKEIYYPFFLNRVACGVIGLGLNEISGNVNFRKKIKIIREILSRPLYKKAFSQLNLEFCPIHWKVFFWFCKRKFATALTILLIIINYLRFS